MFLRAKVLVTGACGFIGSNLVDKLIEENFEVCGIDNLSTGKLENLNKNCFFIKEDIRSCNFYREFGEVQGIFHTAALARIQPSITNPLEYHLVNVVGTLRILLYAIKVGATVIFSGSSSVYGIKNKLSGPIDETFPVNPQSPYAMQKLYCEEYLEMFHKLYGLSYVCLRYFNVYGERQIRDGAYAAVIGIFLDQYAHNQPFTIVGDGLQRRDFTYVQDVVEANLKALESGQISGTFNIGTGKNYSVLDVANMISSSHIKKFLPERHGEAQETLADCQKAHLILNWQAKTNLEDWLNKENK